MSSAYSVRAWPGAICPMVTAGRPDGYGYPRPIIEDWRMTGSPQVDLGLIRKCVLSARRYIWVDAIVGRGLKPSQLASSACMPQNRNGRCVESRLQDQAAPLSVEPRPRGYRLDPNSAAIRARKTVRINILDDGVFSTDSLLQ